MLSYQITYDDLRKIAYRDVLITYGKQSLPIHGKLIPPRKGVLRPYFRIELASSGKELKFQIDSDLLHAFYILVPVQEYFRMVAAVDEGEPIDHSD